MEDRSGWVEVASEGELRTWLERHHDQPDGVWLVTFTKAAGDRYVSREQVLDQLVAFGWCDGILRRIDDEQVRQRVSPRRTQPWAKSYKDRAERLIATGVMAPPGLAAVERARANGMWDAMADVDALVVPDDLAQALAARPPADVHFAAFPPSTRRNVLRWIASAKTAPTRSRRIAATVDDAEKGVRVRSNG